MMPSFTLLLSITGITSLLTLTLWLFIKKSNKIINTNIIICFFFLAIVRLLYPYEYSFTKTLPAKVILPTITRFLREHEFIVHALYFIWFFGIVIGLGKLIISYISLKKWVKTLPEVENLKVQTALTDLLQFYKMKKHRFILKRTSTNVGPLLFGYFHPTIVLPDIELSQNNWHYILQHETAHYFYKHTYFKLLLEILCILYWWNPLYKLMKAEACKSLEINTDLIITKSYNAQKRIEYLECLFTLAKQKFNNKKFPTFLLNFNEYEESHLQKRFQVITESCNTGFHHRKRSIFLYMFLSVFLTIASYTIVFEPYYIPPEDAANTIAITPKNSYIIKINENYYELYHYDEYIGKLEHMPESFIELPLYNSKEELAQKKY